MRIEFDPNKDAANRRKHGISLALAESMDFSTASVRPDHRYDYGEDRLRALGLIGGRLHVLAFTMRGDTLRAISLRKASKREVERHAKEG